LRVLRERAGLSQGALAERAGLAISTLKALERQRRQRPHPHTLGVLAYALGLSSDERDWLLEPAGQVIDQPAGSAGARTASTSGARLPRPPTVLIGRDAEVAHIGTLLDPTAGAARLLTVVGPGGVGKTRLGLEVAVTLVDAYADGVMFVDLAPVRDPRLVAATIARALNLREGGGQSARELLLEYLADRQLLLVLDNFEHVVAAAGLLAELLQRCPRLRMLVTSRAALRLTTERRIRLSPLATPPEDLTSLDGLASSPAVRLFVDRAQTVDADFTLQPNNAAVVGAICRSLEGLPLAIELAAARTVLLTPSALLRRLERRLAVLAGGAADLPERQRALRQTLAWSYDLLGPGEQRLFRRLAVFAGGWTLDSAEAVCADFELPHEAVLDHLHALVDSSLVRSLENPASEPRFGMLESVREYATEQLELAGEKTQLRRQFLAWCLALVQPVKPGPIDPRQLERVAPEFVNIQAALRESIGLGAIEDALWLAAALWMTWYVRGSYGEGRTWLTELLAVPGAEPVQNARAHALLAAGHLAYCQGDYAAAEALLQEARSLADQLGAPQLVGAIRHNLAHVARWRGELAAAYQLYEEALTIFRQLGDRLWSATVLAVMASVLYEQGQLAQAGRCAEASLAFFTETDHWWGMARSLYALGRVAAAQDEHARARSLLEASITLHRRVGDHQGRAWSLVALADELLRAGDVDGAWPLFSESLTLAEMTGDRLTLARSLEALGGLLVTTSPERAVRLAGAADAERMKLGAAAHPAERDHLEAWLSAARSALGPQPYAAAWAGGHAMGTARAVVETVNS
jgi:predicted ATPase